MIKLMYEKGNVPLSTGTIPELPRNSLILLLIGDYAANVITIEDY
jgi:hypothetical protein